MSELGSENKLGKNNTILIVLLAITITVLYVYLGQDLIKQFDSFTDNKPEFKILHPLIGLIATYIASVVYVLSIERKQIKTLIRASLVLLLGILTIYSIYSMKMQIMKNNIDINLLTEKNKMLYDKYNLLLKNSQDKKSIK